MSHKSSRLRRSAGFTLIEVLVAILVFSFGVLGAVGTQARILQLQTQNQDRSRASILANEVVAQMWAQNSVSIDTGAWEGRVKDPSVSGLPNAVGSVSKPDADGMVTVTVTWRPPSMASTGSANRFVTTVVLQ